MGLLDNLDDPQKQMLLQIGLGLLGGAPGHNKSFGADLAHAGTQGLMAYGQQRGLQAKLQEEKQQQEMRAMQMEQMRRQQADDQAIRGAYSKNVVPGMPQMQPTDMETPTGPMGPSTMNMGGLRNDLMGAGPAGFQEAARLAAMNAKERVKLGPGETIGSFQGDKFVPSFAAPDKAPAGFTRGPDGGLVADPNWMKSQIEIAQAKRPQITVDNRQENAFASKVGAEFGDAYVGLQKGDAMASNKINKLSRLESLLNNSGKTGKFTPNTMELKAAADSLGFKVDSKLPYQQAAQALSNEIALEMRNPSGGAGMPGALSDSDRVFLTNMVPNLAKTPEGNKELLATAKKLAQRDKEVAALAREYKQKNGRFDEGFYEVLSRYSARNPLFPEQKDPYAGFSSTVVKP